MHDQITYLEGNLMRRMIVLEGSAVHRESSRRWLLGFLWTEVYSVWGLGPRRSTGDAEESRALLKACFTWVHQGLVWRTWACSLLCAPFRYNPEPCAASHPIPLAWGQIRRQLRDAA